MLYESCSVIKSDVLESATSVESVTRAGKVQNLNRQKIRVGLNNGKSESFSSELIDEVPFEPGETALIVVAKRGTDRGNVIYVQNLNTRKVRAKPAYKPDYTRFGVAMRLATWATVTSVPELILLALIAGFFHITPMIKWIFAIQWIYVSLISFWQFSKFWKEFMKEDRKEFAALVVKTAKNYGVNFDPESFTSKTNYKLVRI